MTAQNTFSSILFAVVMLSAGCKAKHNEKLPFYNTPDFTPQWIASGGKDYEAVHTIGAFSFTNQQGRTITNRDVQGKIYVASFFFTRCSGICLKMNNNLKKVANAFAANDDVLILSHTVTPESDSVIQLAKYGQLHNINAKKWWLLTGSKEATYALARRSYFADEETGYRLGSNEFLHTENAVLIDRNSRIRGVYNTTVDLEINKLLEHIKLLLAE